MTSRLIHVSDVLKPRQCKKCSKEWDVVGSAYVGGNVFKTIKKFFQGKTKVKPSTVLKGVSKALGYANKYGSYVPGLSAFVPAVAGIASHAANYGAKELKKRGRAMVAGSKCGSSMVAGNYYPSPFVRTSMRKGSSMVAGSRVAGAMVAGAAKSSTARKSKSTKKRRNTKSARKARNTELIDTVIKRKIPKRSLRPPKQSTVIKKRLFDTVPESIIRKRKYEPRARKFKERLLEPEPDPMEIPDIVTEGMDEAIAAAETDSDIEDNPVKQAMIAESKRKRHNRNIQRNQMANYKRNQEKDVGLQNWIDSVIEEDEDLPRVRKTKKKLAKSKPKSSTQKKKKKSVNLKVRKTGKKRKLGIGGPAQSKKYNPSPPKRKRGRPKKAKTVPKTKPKRKKKVKPLKRSVPSPELGPCNVEACKKLYVMYPRKAKGQRRKPSKPNAWITFLKKFKQDNPSIKGREVMKQASRAYRASK